jgi:hypothetical protein
MEWSDSPSGDFNPGKNAHNTHRISGWVGPKTGLYAVNRREVQVQVSYHCNESNDDSMVDNLAVAILSELSQFLN